MYLILLWALVGLIGHVHGKCSLTPITDDERSIAYVCTDGDLNDLAEISSDTDWIEFSVSRFHHIPDNAFARFKNLRRLLFYNCHVNYIDPDAFAGLDRLEWLTFHGTKIHVARTAWFRGLRNLRKLTLDRCGLEYVETDVFRALPRLETLSLRDNDLDCLPIDELSYLRMLRTVRIDGNPWLCQCRQRLDRFFRERSIVQEKQCGDIQSRGNYFQTSVLSSLDRLSDKTSWILISGLRVDTLPNYVFFRFGNTLESLELRDCSITSVENFAFAGLHRLSRLTLTGNHFTVVGVNWFRDLLSLQQLVLQRNDIERIDRTALWHLAGSLRHLDLRDNRLRCLAIEELTELKKLERLDSTGNPWTCTCRRNLQNFLTEKNVGFEISGRCYENENDIPEVTVGWHQQPTSQENSSVVGTVRWTSYEERIRNSNVTIIRPPRPTATIEIQVPTTQSPMYQGSCRPESSSSNSRPIYTCSGINSVEELGVIPHTVHTIRIILSNIKRIPQNTFSRFNGYLSRLELRDCGIEKIDYQAFSGLYNLEYLSLHNNQLDSVTMDTVQGLSRLRYLDLSHNHIYRITNDVFDSVPYLTSLDISENSMNCIGVEHMFHRLPYLSTLKVSNNPWSCLCGKKLAEFMDRRRIQNDKDSLIHSNEECYATSIPTQSTIPMVPTTSAVPPEEIHQTVEGTCVSYDDVTGLRYRCSGGNLLLLETIPSNVSAIEFTEGHLPYIPAGCFSRFTNLRELIIRNSGLANIEQGAFDGLDKLVNLTIHDNPLKVVGSSWFVLKNLERLDLRGNNIEYIAPGAFQHLPELLYLNLEGNDLKCIFTSDLDDMRNVYIVEFAGNPLKWRCRVELEQFLEAKKIRFVKIENSCEGKKLVRNLLLQNRTDGSFDCPSECSAASKISGYLVIFFCVLPLFSMGIFQ